MMISPGEANCCEAKKTVRQMQAGRIAVRQRNCREAKKKLNIALRCKLLCRQRKNLIVTVRRIVNQYCPEGCGRKAKGILCKGGSAQRSSNMASKQQSGQRNIVQTPFSLKELKHGKQVTIKVRKKK
jgi:hypothetical protein